MSFLVYQPWHVEYGSLIVGTKSQLAGCEFCHAILCYYVETQLLDALNATTAFGDLSI